ncbi:hypothetical protein QUF76_11450 [Desulfobacterales bacterium HSG16]|nr:hypothetical protein [Desulfobacterales bacterium HSG16]
MFQNLCTGIYIKMQNMSKNEVFYRFCKIFAILLCLSSIIATGIYFHRKSPSNDNSNKARIEELKAKLTKIKNLREKLSGEQEQLGEKKEDFIDKIDEIKEEIKEELNAAKNPKRLDNRFDNLQEYDAFLQEIDRRLKELEHLPDNFLSIERHFDANIEMLGLKSEADFDKLKNQMTKFISENSYNPNKIMIDKTKIHFKSKEELLKEIELSRKKQRKGYSNYTKNKQIWDETCQAIFFRTSQLTELSPKAAKCSLRIKDTLDFRKVTKLRPLAAKALIEWDGDEINFDSLKSISRSTARYLAQWKGGSKRTRLKLNGLTSITPQIAQYLAKSKAAHLELNGLKSLSRDAAKYLSQGAYHHLSLEGLKSLKSGAGVYLANYKGTLYVSYKIEQRIYGIKYLNK